MPAANVAPTEATPPPTLATPRYPLLDSMRGIAALSVFAAHVLIFLFAYGTEEARPLMTRLDPGIALFLLLSGFLLYRPYVTARFRGKQAPSVVPFALRRFLRIFPVYWVILIAVALYFGMSYVWTLDGFFKFFGLFQVYDSDTILGGVAQSWTICVELGFYVMLPIWAVGMRRVRFRSTRGFLVTEGIFLAVVFVFAVVWKTIAFNLAPSGLAFGTALGSPRISPGLFTLPAYLDALAVGMGLAVLSVVVAERERDRPAVRFIDRKPWVFVLAAVVFYWLSGVAGGTYEVDSASGFVIHQQFNLLVALCLFLPAVFGDWRRGLWRRFLANRALMWLATISYSFYLWHLSVMTALAQQGWLEGSPGPVAFVLASFALTIVLSAASWYGVGRPAVRLGGRIPRAGSPREVFSALFRPRDRQPDARSPGAASRASGAAPAGTDAS